MLIAQSMPNRLPVKVTASSAAWKAVAHDGTLYDDLAALKAAGKRPFPGLQNPSTGDALNLMQALMIRTENASGADGSPVYVAFNRSTAPTDDTADHLVSGSGQQLSVSGQMWNLWLRKTTAGDEVFLTGMY